VKETGIMTSNIW